MNAHDHDEHHDPSSGGDGTGEDWTQQPNPQHRQEDPAEGPDLPDTPELPDVIPGDPPEARPLTAPMEGEVPEELEGPEA